ncbi:SHOCT domain-containing protein [Desulfovibrio oxyclinae]|jgi:putative membrane protein|uniref:SHOCT domain-containing protein n=1 Tax=Desulfovibrio oxyclinae TaxID=63560 RepID=UPI000373367D|nr:SHOCT domain-containing protein [Desulfovibrio oxyclinae]
MDMLSAFGNWFCNSGFGYGHGHLGGGGFMSSGWLPFHMPFGGLIGLLLLGTLIFMGVRLFRSRQPSHQTIAMDVIKRRYAEGEIDDATYEKLRAAMKR